MSSEKRRIAPYALEREVPPLKTRVGASPFWSSNRRFKVQQTQKSFSMIMLGTPRKAPDLPKTAALSDASLASEAIHWQRPICVRNGAQRRAHPGRGLNGRRSEPLLVARRQLARRRRETFGRPCGPRWRSA